MRVHEYFHSLCGFLNRHFGVVKNLPEFIYVMFELVVVGPIQAHIRKLIRFRTDQTIVDILIHGACYPGSPILSKQTDIAEGFDGPGYDLIDMVYVTKKFLLNNIELIQSEVFALETFLHYRCNVSDKTNRHQDAGGKQGIDKGRRMRCQKYAVLDNRAGIYL